MATIRQEINILCEALTADAISSARVQINTASYSGSCTYWLEVVGKRASGTCTVTLRDAVNNIHATCSITGTTDALVRAQFSTAPDAGAATYYLNIAGGSTTPIIKAARVVVLQTSTPLTATETQIEIGSSWNTGTGTAAAPPSNPKYWKYTSANWDGTLTVYFEATFKSGTSKSAATVVLQVADGSGDGFAGWAAVTNGTVATSATVATLVRGTSAVTLVAGRNYRIAVTSPSSKSPTYVYNAKIVIVSSTQLTQVCRFDASISGPTDNDGVWSNDSYAFDSDEANCATTDILGTVGTNELRGVGTTANAAWTYPIISVVARTLAGVGASWSDYCALNAPSGGWSWDKVANLELIVFASFVTTYYIESRAYYLGNLLSASNWFAISNADNYRMYVCYAYVTYNSVASGITKLEPQYLLANTTLVAGTSLQTHLTKWYSTEWADVTNTYYHAVCASNDNTSHVDLAQADGGGLLSGSTVTHPDNHGMSASVTMPASENLDVQIATDSGSIYASRILVYCVVSSTYIKTRNGLARASMKTLNNLASASVKSINGLT